MAFQFGNCSEISMGFRWSFDGISTLQVVNLLYSTVHRSTTVLQSEPCELVVANCQKPAHFRVLSVGCTTYDRGRSDPSHSQSISQSAQHAEPEPSRSVSQSAQHAEPELSQFVSQSTHVEPEAPPSTPEAPMNNAAGSQSHGNTADEPNNSEEREPRQPGRPQPQPRQPQPWRNPPVVQTQSKQVRCVCFVRNLELNWCFKKKCRSFMIFTSGYL